MVFIDIPSTCVLYMPIPISQAQQCPEIPQDRVVLTYVELQALKLVYLDNLTQHEAALRMGLPRSTFWRILENARRS